MNRHRLAARIMSAQAEIPVLGDLVPGSDGYRAFQHMAAAYVPVLRNEANKVIADDVAEFYASHDRLTWDVRDDVPNWAPPWGTFFVEWNTPPAEVWNVAEGEFVPPPGQCGLACLAVKIPEAEEQTADYWDRAKRFLSNSLLMCNPIHLTPDKADFHKTLLEGAKWVIVCDTWMTEFRRPLLGRPLWTGARFGVAVAGDGRYLRHTNAIFEGSPTSPNVLAVLGLTLSFFHCKNVVKTERKEPAIHTGLRKSPRPPAIRYTVLDVNPMRTTLKQEGGSESVGVKKAMHICRGHFANYSSDAPLFGKHVGQFWVSDHVRGSRESGEVRKTYRQTLGTAGTDDRT